MSELTLDQVIETKRGLPYAQALSEIQGITKDVVGPIEGKDLRDVVTVLCSGLAYRLEEAPGSPIRTALLRAFSSMSINEFGFNLTDPVVVQLLDAGVVANLIDVNERLWFYAIATKQVPTYPSVQLKDVIAYFEPGLVDTGEWTTFSPTSNRLILNLSQDTPELAAVRIEQRVSHDGIHWTNWDRLTPIIVQAAGVYYHSIPASNMQRQIRWRGEQYRITGTLEAV